MPDKPEDRVDRIVENLLKERRLRLRPGDAGEKEAIVAAAKLAGARSAQHHMSPAFRRRLSEQVEGAQRTGWVTRRSALVAGLGVVAGALAGGVIGRALEPAPQPLPATLVKPFGGKWTDVGALADFRDGEAMRVTAGAIGAFVLRRGDSVSAVSSICSHLPCELSRQASDGLLNCPCHHVTFTPDGQPTSKAYPLPSLAVVQIRVTKGRVEVMGTS